MELEFSGPVFSWRGPSPYHFVAVPEEECDELREAAAVVSYGWGVIPVAGRIGSTDFTTSLFPKDGGYLVPIKDAVRKGEALDVGETVTIRLSIDL